MPPMLKLKDGTLVMPRWPEKPGESFDSLNPGLRDILHDDQEPTPKLTFDLTKARQNLKLVQSRLLKKKASPPSS